MVDENQIHDEYQLADLDGLDTAADASETEEPVQFKEKKTFNYSDNTRRNAMIVLAVCIFAIIVYKFVSSHSAQKKHASVAAQTVPKVPAAVIPPPAPTAFNAQPAPMPAPAETVRTMVAEADAKIVQKLNTLELNQRSMRDDVTSVSNQMGTINNNFQEVMGKMAEISKAVTNLSAITEAQSREIERLVAQKAKKAKPIVAQSTSAPIKYYLQAVIPGRAWLMSTSGNSVTVRVGTVVQGYGIVKLIDAIQGRVMTSSGQIIKFSQADS